MPLLSRQVVLTPRTALAVARRRGGREEGFSLVETVIALVVFSLVMASLAGVFLTSTRQVGSLRDRQTAASIAQQALEIARSVQAAPDTNGCPKLLQGRSQAAVTAQWAAAPNSLDLSTTDMAWMPNTCSGSVVVPLQGLARTALSAPIDPLVVAGQTYRVRTYIGTCTMVVAGGPCLPAGQLTGRLATLFRVVATVSWSGPGCGTGCSFSAATLIDPSTDPLFNARNALPTAPLGLTADPGESSAVMSWGAPSSSNGATIVSYTVTATPVGGGASHSCTSLAPITYCTLTGLTNGITYSATVAGRSSYATGASSGTVQFIPYPKDVMSAARLVLWLDGADSGTLLASSACTGAPATAAVGCWKDKSTQLNNATQAGAAGQPSLTTVSTRQVPGFDGSSDYLDLATAKLPTGTSTATAFVVGTMTDPVPTSAYTHRSVLNYGGVSGGGMREIQKETGTTNVRASLGSAGVLTQPLWSASPTIVAATWVSNGLSLWASGGSGVTATATYSGTGTTYAHVGAYGASGGMGQYWFGAIPEVIVLNSTVTAAERRLVEEYLSRKWSAALVPTAPTDLAVTSVGATTATLSFTAPTYDGGSAITGYTALVTPSSGSPVTVSCAASPCSLTGLAVSTAYTVTVTATNAMGAGAASAAASFTTTAQLTNAPTGVVATPGDASAAVSWTAPTVVGTGITGYTVTATPTAGTGFAEQPSRTCSTTGTRSCTVSGLVNGLTYSVVVTPSNAAGAGTPSTAVTVIPYPATLLATANLGGWWDAADTSRLLNASGTAATSGQPVATWNDRSGRSVTMTQATAGSRGTVGAINGKPAWQSTASTWMSTTVSSTYRDVFSVADPSTSVSWGTTLAAPANTDFSQRTLNRYLANTTGQPAATSADWSWGNSPGVWTNGLSAGNPSAGGPSIYVSQAGSAVTGTASLSTSYSGRGMAGPIGEVIATNRVFTAAERRTVEEYLSRKWLVGITPAAPTITSATGSTTTGSVAFTAPSYDGGRAVTSYTVTAVPSSGTTVTATCTASPCALTGLVGGAAYTVTMTATNAIGAGPASASAPLSTYTLPGAPTGLGATAADGSATLTWTAPAVTGGGITSYTATGVPGDGSANVTCSSATTGCTLTGLTNGVTYTVTVKATNAAGTGPASSSRTVIPYPNGVMSSSRLELWLDGADTSTLFQDSACGTAVTASGQSLACWKDKSGNGNATQSSSTYFPTTATFSGRVVPSFNGSSDFLNVDVAQLSTGTTASTIVTSAVMTDGSPASSSYRTVVNYGSISVGKARGIFKDASGSGILAGTWAANAVTAGTWNPSAAQVAVAQFASPLVSLWTAGQARVDASSAAFSTNSSVATIGMANNTYWWQGQIPEVMIFTGTLTADERRDVEEYLARKWGSPITPSAPTALTATPLATSATISFTPGWNGGSAITSYSVTAVPSSGSTVTATCSASPCTLTGLSPGTSYTVTVTPTNSLGTGLGSAALAMTTPVPPGAPTGVSVTPSDGALAASWSAPGVVGSGITGYTATATPTAGTGYASASAQTCTTTGTRSCVVTGLVNGLTYSVTVQATNSGGNGPASTAATGIPYPSTVMSGTQLQLWLDGRDVDGDGTGEGTAEQCDTGTSCSSLSNVLKRWKDKSGSARDGVQATSSMAGTYVPASGQVTFSGNGYYQAANVAVGPDVTAFTVARSSAGSWNATGWLLGTRAANGFVLQPNSGGTSVQAVAMRGSGTNSPAVTTAAQSPSSITSPHLYDTQVSGTTTVSATLALDGNVGATGTGTSPTARAASAQTLTVGADDLDLAARRGSGAFSEALVFGAALSADDRRTVAEYLGRKWGLTITARAPEWVLAAANGAGSIKVTWSAPVWDGGSAPTDYVVQYRRLGTSTWTTWAHTASAALTQTLTGLTSGSTYEVQVAAVNAAGTGSFSEPSQGTAPSVLVPARWGGGSPVTVVGPAAPALPVVSRGGSAAAVVTISRAGAGR